MLRHKILAALLATSALSFAALPATAASTKDQARAAVAAADAKVHTAEDLNTATQAPRDTADARAALTMAHDSYNAGRHEQAIENAIRAQAAADAAIGLAQQHKDNALAAARADQRATSEAARDQVAAAQDQADVATQQSAAAQQQAAEANARADAAQNSAAASAADAAAARNAAMIAAQNPAAAPVVETTITTQKSGVAPRGATTRKVVRRATGPVAAAPSEKITATTKVTPQQ